LEKTKQTFDNVMEKIGKKKLVGYDMSYSATVYNSCGFYTTTPADLPSEMTIGQKICRCLLASPERTEQLPW